MNIGLRTAQIILAFQILMTALTQLQLIKNYVS